MQVTEHIHALHLPFQVVTPTGTLERFVVVYLIVGDTMTLIDAGVAGSEAPIAEYVRGIGRRPEEISTLLLTHAHPDHVGAARAVREMTGCRVFVHAAERAWAEDVQLQARQRPVPGFDRLVGGSVPVDRALQDGDVLNLAPNLTLEVIHAPGHSPGSACFLLREEGALFTGDVVPLAGDMPIFDDAEASIASIERLQGIVSVKLLLAAWDEPRRGPEAAARLEEGAAWLRRVEEAVCAAGPADDGLELCRRVLPALGLPMAAANPLVARTFLSVEAKRRAASRR
ncbi:MAG TPA: MBL fold metallo-hydrolase [Armatimonadota bacterium]|jgi:glyoxylase-like metal-dependent hydrolase (beta-lactamase superfamily II)